MSTRPPSRVVFVGNIPYGLSEEQISEIFSSAGRVLNFRLVYDRETGRPKGFGFAEFPDPDSAASAVRNLNDYEIMGRKLRVDFSNEGGNDDDNRDRDGGASANANSGYGHGQNGYSGAPGNSIPPLPAGKDLPPGVSATDSISRTLNTLPPAQLLDILSQMKALAVNDPARCTELLNQAPQLSYAVFQSLLLMGLVSPNAINSVLEDGPAPPPAQPIGYGGGYNTATPPVAGGYAPPPAPVHAALPPVALPAAAPGQDPNELLQAVLGLPDEMINQLPEVERQQVLALRAQFASQAQFGQRR
ncbi:hypothetical protein GQ53DRAFT_729408 [Thozetella sp. PMI_491]|nr:hypothetical protein GQ53DRAFT_729408 [Thozetella sp. PMI_491]